MFKCTHIMVKSHHNQLGTIHERLFCQNTMWPPRWGFMLGQKMTNVIINVHHQIMDANVCKSMDFLSIGCESLPLFLGHGLLAPHGNSQSKILTLTKWWQSFSLQVFNWPIIFLTCKLIVSKSSSSAYVFWNYSNGCILLAIMSRLSG
jgi:hypothetical protein